MLPYLLIAAGAYLVGQSRKNEKFAKGGETHGFKFLDGGDGVEYEIWEKDGVRYRVPIERDEDVEGEYEELIIHRYFEDAEPMDMADGGEIVTYKNKKDVYYDRETRNWVEKELSFTKGQLVIYNHSDKGNVEARFLGKSGENKAKIEILMPYKPWTKRVDSTQYVSPAGRTEPAYYLNEVPRGTKKTVSVDNITAVNERYFSHHQRPISQWLKSPEFKDAFSYLDTPKMENGGVTEMRKKIAQMNIILNTSSGQVYVGGIKNKNKLFKDENGYHLIEGYWKFMGKRYPLKKYFTASENEVLNAYMQDQYAKGGETKWIQKAIKKPGSLRAEAKREGLIEGDEKLSKTDLKKLEKKGGKTARRARLAQTLKTL